MGGVQGWCDQGQYFTSLSLVQGWCGAVVVVVTLPDMSYYCTSLHLVTMVLGGATYGTNFVLFLR